MCKIWWLFKLDELANYFGNRDFCDFDRRKTLIKSTLITALLIGCTLLGRSPAIIASSPPNLLISPASWDFGQIDDRQIVSHTFILSNIGGATLDIYSAETSCTCTTAVLSAEEIKPGEKLELKVSFNPKGRSGKFKNYVVIDSSDPDQPVQRIAISGQVVSGGHRD